jgi:predicted NBD/HSP70 family sugar kinase
MATRRTASQGKTRSTTQRAVIGIDLGGTKIAAGKVVDGAVVQRIVLPTLADRGRAFVLDQIIHILDVLDPARRMPVGIGVPGSFSGTRIVHLPHVPCLDGVDLSRALRVPASRLAIENDARCFALAEQRSGAAKGKRLVYGVTLGTGTGGGIIIDGKIYAGAHGAAGETGHAWSAAHKEWESVISGSALVAYYRARGGKAEHVSDLWRERTPAAKATRAYAVDNIATFLGTVILLLDPDVVVLGGGASNAPLVTPVNAELRRRGVRPIIVQNLLGKDGGIIGAALVVRR